MPTKITPQERIVLAAWFARSNMGQPRAERFLVESLLNVERKWPLTLQAAVERLCSPYMETDEHEKIFQEEGVSWFRKFSPNGSHNNREAIIKTWPDVEAYFWPKQWGKE